MLAEEVTGQLPRLARLGRLEPHTRVSLGLLLDEQAARAPDAVFFLFEDRAYTHGAVKRRIDNVVRGLLSLGVRQGEHVGVLMGTRPSGALGGRGAQPARRGRRAAAPRRPGRARGRARPGDADRRRPRARRPRRATPAAPRCSCSAAAARSATSAPSVDRHGAHRPRRRSSCPPGTGPTPAAPRDLAFVLFTGEGERTRANRITNGRWALSAFGTASAAALSDADTVYAVTPIYHPSGLLMSIGGAIAGGARLAIARDFDPETFWEEVRRYGVTVASYTWTMLRELADAPPDPAERHHPVRLFIGAGMPRGLWRRVARRFAPARVLEFYASTEGEAILVNLSGDKPGCKGRPLPGQRRGAPRRLRRRRRAPARARRRLRGRVPRRRGRDAADPAARRRRDHATSPLRGVFEPDDAWLATGDLFRADEDGDFWLVDHVGGADPHRSTASSPPFPIVDALGDLDAVDLAVVYGVPAPARERSLAVAAVTLRPGLELDGGRDRRRRSAALDAGRAARTSSTSSTRSR